MGTIIFHGSGLEFGDLGFFKFRFMDFGLSPANPANPDPCFVPTCIEQVSVAYMSEPLVVVLSPLS